MTSAIAHLSFPVRDLDEAIDFYCASLGGERGRRTSKFADVFVFGTQLTLHDEPESVADDAPHSRHFGWTLPWSQWEALAARISGSSAVVSAATVSFEGAPHEQAKLMLSDPSGYLIELKAYRNPGEVLGSLAR